MPDQDIPFIDEHVAGLPAELRNDLAELGRNDLYFFAKGIMGFKDMTQRCHGPLCAFASGNPSLFKMMLHPRDTFKSSVITIAGTAQRVTRDVEGRNLIRNETATNAERFLRSIRQHAEGNRIFRALYSEIIPKDTRRIRWNDSELDFARKGHYPEPTVSAIGIGGTSTSQHFTHITDDDPISEEAVKSEKVMQDAIIRLSSIDALLVDPQRNTHWLVGTRWSFADAYTWYEKAFGRKLSKFIRGAVEDGEPIFPERLNSEVLADIRLARGEYLYSCNYMNNPRNIDVQDLNVEDLRFWKWLGPDRIELLNQEGVRIDAWRLDELDVTITVDPASAETVNSDRNAITVVGMSPRNQMICLEAFAARCTPLIVVEKMIEFTKHYAPRKVGIENVGYQRALKYFIKQEGERHGLYIRIEPLKASGKDKPHVRGLQPIMATGKLFVLPTMLQLRQEMADYPLGEHDDVVDSLAMHLQLIKGQMSPEYQAKLKEEEKRLLRKVRAPYQKPSEAEIRAKLGLDPDEDIDEDEVAATFGAQAQEWAS